ncbi:MAG: agmatinase [Rickettsiales bacterium]|nr:agmatinase [Rickettsiales bacterium]
MKLVKPSKAFLGLDVSDSVSYQDAKAVIIPFGLEKSVSYFGGTRNGPRAIIRASHEVELFDEEFWIEPHKEIGIVTFKEPKIHKNLSKSLEQLNDIVEKVVDDNKFPLVLGGEHSISAGSIRPFVKKYKDLAILHFDAHADLRDGYEGEYYSHASALRRCLDDKAQKSENNIDLVSIGIRNISSEEIPFLERNQHRINMFFAKDKKNWDIEKIVSILRNRPVYLTFDVDGFDSSLMPATGTPEPGGLFWDDVIEIISKVSKNSNIVGADVNELSPRKGMHSCDFLAAKLVYKILSYSFIKR